jgi:hypothetical protein
MAPPAKKRRGAAAGPDDGVVSRAVAWLESYPKVSRWAARYDLLRLIDGGGGIVRLDSFLPGFVAEGALRMLEGLPPGRWNDTAAEEDYTVGCGVGEHCREGVVIGGGGGAQ